jgi:hypothetical protein
MECDSVAWKRNDSEMQNRRGAVTAENVLQSGSKIGAAQERVCATFGTPYVACPSDSLIRLSPNLRAGTFPIHGVRFAPGEGSCGWYIWSGDESACPEFFLSVEASLLVQWAPITLPFLGLPDGWRFILTHDDVEVWEEK